MCPNTKSIPAFTLLPTDVSPVNYKVKLTPDLSNFTFAGEVEITVKIHKKCSKIVMNSHELTIKSASYSPAAAAPRVETASIEMNVEEQTVSFQFSRQLQPGTTGVVSVVYDGILNRDMKGFYAYMYKKDGVEKYGAATQFENSYARQCLPCFDEPAHKATFDSTLVVDSDLVALSNNNVVNEATDVVDGSKKVITYERTPLMSTYLLAYVIGEYEFVEGHSSTGVLVRLYTPVGKTSQGTYGLDVAVKSLDLFEEYFDFPYPLNKLDLVTIPDFGSGAMENWGLITFRECKVLVDAKLSSTAQKTVATVYITHEVAHMWFGNLVTMQWWKQLWLNEGFANFMECVGTDHCDPSFEIWHQYMCDNFIVALDLDALDNSHAIEIDVKTPAEASEVFDSISYDKGSAVVRMIYYWIGADKFQAGVRAYFKKHAYQNTVSEDLWAAFESASGLPVEDVMSTWTTKMGYPVLDVSEVSSTDDSVTLKISQRKYCSDMTGGSVSDDLWSIPINFITSGNGGRDQSLLLTTRETEFTVDNVPKDGFVKLNPDWVGFYRVNYSEDMLTKLIAAIDGNELSSKDRLNVQNDVFAMASAGLTSHTSYLKMLTAFGEEMDYVVLFDISSKLDALNPVIWLDTETHAMFKEIKQTIFTKVAKKLGFDSKPGESHLHVLLRAKAIASSGSEEILAESKKRLMESIASGEALPGDICESVYHNYVSMDGVEALEQMLVLYEASVLAEEQNRILRSLGNVTDAVGIDVVLDFAFSSKVRDNVRNQVVASLATSSKLASEKVWQFFKANFGMIIDKLNGKLLSSVIGSSTMYFATEEMLADVVAFFNTNARFAEAKRKIEQSFEKIQMNVFLCKRDAANIKAYLQSR